MLFSEHTTIWYGLLRLYVPNPSSLDPVALVLSALAFVLLFHRGIMTTLAICGALGVGRHLLAR